MFWSEREIHILKTMVENGYYIDDVMAVLKHRTKNSIDHKVRYLNLKWNWESRKKIDEALFNKLVNGGKSWKRQASA